MIESMFIDLAFAKVSAGSTYVATPSTGAGRASAGAGATEGADGKPDSGAGPAGFSPDFFMVIMLVIIAMIGFSFMSQRKQKKRQQAMLDGVGKRAVVQTIGGIIGTVVDIRGDRIVLSVHEGSNSRLTVARSAIQQTLEPVEATDDDNEDYDNQDDDNDRDAEAN